MTLLIDDLRFERLTDDIAKLQGSLVACDVSLSEDAKLLRRLIHFLMEALIHFKVGLKEHTIEDVKY